MPVVRPVAGVIAPPFWGTEAVGFEVLQSFSGQPDLRCNLGNIRDT